MSTSQPPCLVGYALNSKKLRPSEGKHDFVVAARPPAANWCGGGLADILDANSDGSGGVKFQLWDPAVPVAQQPKFHIIVHKLTEDLGGGGGSVDKSSASKIALLKEYLLANPSTKIVDPIESVRNVVSRELTCRALDRTLGAQQPKYFIHRHCASGANSVEFLASMREHGLDFPLICKPVSACGTPASHQMTVVVALSGLEQVLTRRAAPDAGYLVQQFHNHDSIFYKVYVIDRDVMVFKRRSLPNLSPDNRASARSVEFDSRFPYPTIDDFLHVPPDPTSPTPVRLTAKGGSTSLQLAPDTVQFQNFRDLASAIRAEFVLTLFGFDVIIPTEHPDQLLVVDVNFFPSYKEVPDFPQRFVDYLRRKGLE